MIERSIRVHSLFESGEAAVLVQTASRFNSRISLMHEDKTANAKSIMGIISLDLKSGQTVRIIADGEDEQSALPVLEQLLGTSSEPA
ncbi:MAG: HPr family phosphocarrier protein [Defluviitaleaceae bacterium]|nr:HPr family phosphocarrier protein [Defluviitaleaceae bacterium]MCL2239018.1 HPr family phosphocarrier protein [Defluviitaleaceae bacterium]